MLQGQGNLLVGKTLCQAQPVLPSCLGKGDGGCEDPAGSARSALCHPGPPCATTCLSQPAQPMPGRWHRVPSQWLWAGGPEGPLSCCSLLPPAQLVWGALENSPLSLWGISYPCPRAGEAQLQTDLGTWCHQCWGQWPEEGNLCSQDRLLLCSLQVPPYPLLSFLYIYFRMI